MSLRKLQRRLTRQRIHNRNVELAQLLNERFVHEARWAGFAEGKRIGAYDERERLTRYIAPNEREQPTLLCQAPELPRIVVPIRPEMMFARDYTFESHSRQLQELATFEARPVRLKIQSTVIQWWEWLPVRHHTGKQRALETMQGLCDDLREAAGHMVHDHSSKFRVEMLAERIERLIPTLRADTGIVREEVRP